LLTKKKRPRLRKKKRRPCRRYNWGEGQNRETWTMQRGQERIRGETNPLPKGTWSNPQGGLGMIMVTEGKRKKKNSAVGRHRIATQ